MFVVGFAAICHRLCHHNCFIHLVPSDTKLVSSSPAAKCPSQLSSDEMLEGESDLLLCIAVEIYKRPELDSLACKLFDGGIGRKSQEYINDKAAKMGTRDPAVLARELLYDWVRERPMEATKTRLYEILSKIQTYPEYKFKPFLTSKLELHDQLTNQLYISCEKKKAQVQLL